jgi:hypothetical protein
MSAIDKQRGPPIILKHSREIRRVIEKAFLGSPCAGKVDSFGEMVFSGFADLG